MGHILRYKILILVMLALPLVAIGQGTDNCYRSDYGHGKATGIVCTEGPKYSISDRLLTLKGVQDQYRTATISKPLTDTYYSIEAKVRQTSGSDTKALGLVFQSRGTGNSNVLLISSSGFYSIGFFESGKYHNLCKWTKCEAIRSQGKYNTLTIRCVNGVTDYYINGEQVFSYNKVTAYGNNHGYILKDNIEIQSEYIEIHTYVDKYEFQSERELVKSVDSEYSEIAPIESVDGKVLYFSRVSHPANNGGEEDCDIWYSQLEGDSYSKPVHLPAPVNNKNINAVIKAEGNTLYVEGSYGRDGQGLKSDGITMFTRQGDSWAKPTGIVISDFYNNNKHGTYTFSSDNKVIIMALERQDTHGGLDLYISFLRQDGTYSAPKNLGSRLNTNVNDGTPYLSADDKMLYFSSYGHQSFGSSDIFVSYREDDTWLNWSEPDNLGPMVNTPSWDAYFSISADNEHAYYVSTYNEDFTESIYRIGLPGNLRPVPSNILEGIVENKNSQTPISASLQYVDESDTSYTVTNRQGMFVIRRDYNTKFRITASAPGYWPATVKYSENPGKTLRIKMTPLERGTTVILHNIHFETATTELTSSSVPELENLRSMMQGNPNIKIQINGYAYPSGNPQKLQELSENRAIKVKNYLTDHGISASRIVCKGFGGSKPVHIGSTEQDRVLNRRVEFTIIEK